MDTSFLELPYEVLDIILSLLSYKDKVQCRFVCSKFKDIVDYSIKSGLHCTIDENSTQSLSLAKNARVRIAKFRSFSSINVQENSNEEKLNEHFLAYPHSLLMAKIIGPIDYFWFRVKFLTHVQNSLKKIVMQGHFLAEKPLQERTKPWETVILPNLRILEIICIDVSAQNTTTEFELSMIGKNLELILSTLQSKTLELLYIFDFDLTQLEAEYYGRSFYWRDVTLRKFLNVHKDTLQTVCLPAYIGNHIECQDRSIVGNLTFPENLNEYEILLTRRSALPEITPVTLSSIRNMNNLKHLRLNIVKFPVSIISDTMMNLPNTLCKLEICLQLRSSNENLIIDGTLFSNFSNLKQFEITNWAMKWGWNESIDNFQNDCITVINLTALPADLEILYLRKISVEAFPAILLKPFKKLTHVAIGPIMEMDDDNSNSLKIVQHFLRQRKMQSLILFFRKFEPSCQHLFKELLRREETNIETNLQNPNLNILEHCSSILCSPRARERKLYRLWDTIGLGLQNYYPKQHHNVSLALGIQIELSYQTTQILPLKPAKLREQLSYKFDVKGFQMNFGNFAARNFKLSDIMSNLIMCLDSDYTIEQRNNGWAFWQ